MSMDDLLYGNALRGAPNRYASKMAVNRTQIRNLLLPGKYQWDAKRGIPFTDDEFEAVVDAYMANGSMTDAKRVADGFIALPLVLQSKQRQLTPLRSVSPAYKQSQIPIHFRSNQKDASHAHRRSTQKAPHHTPQPPDTRWHGGHQAGDGGAGGWDRNDITSIINAYAAIGVRRTEITASHLAAAQHGFLIPAGSQLANNIIGPFPYTQPAAGWCAGNSTQLQRAQAAANYGGFSQLGGAFLHTGPMSASGGFRVGSAHPSYSPQPPPKPLPTKIKAGEIVAWRCWVWHDGTLRSMTQPTTWKKGEPVEGDPSTGVGVHAWKTRAQAEKYGREAFYGDKIAFGTVELWGQVIEHDEGYRAQFGELKEIVGHVTSNYRLQTVQKKATSHSLWDEPALIIAALAALAGVIVLMGVLSSIYIDRPGAARSGHHCPSTSCRPHPAYLKGTPTR